MGIYLPESLYSLVLLLYSWGSLFGVPIRTLLVSKRSSEGHGQACVWVGQGLNLSSLVDRTRAKPF